jgi:hypothetical protein
MANCFMAGAELVRWELIALGQDGPYRLSIHHAGGAIVEYFETVTAALLREKELEELLIAARAGAGHGGEPVACERAFSS